MQNGGGQAPSPSLTYQGKKENRHSSRQSKAEQPRPTPWRATPVSQAAPLPTSPRRTGQRPTCIGYLGTPSHNTATTHRLAASMRPFADKGRAAGQGDPELIQKQPVRRRTPTLSKFLAKPGRPGLAHGSSSSLRAAREGGGLGLPRLSLACAISRAGTGPGTRLGADLGDLSFRGLPVLSGMDGGTDRVEGGKGGKLK